ncbi:MAG TPA: hypothetical protein VN781_09030 [Acidimicrobiales bacterium]|nr:hypothetical protein [Acidimicrobiales bacterium]
MSEAAGSERAAPPIGRWLVGFGRFWWDFLVGDTPELTVGGILAVGVAAAITVDRGLVWMAVAALPLVVGLVLGGSVRRAARR